MRKIMKRKSKSDVSSTASSSKTEENQEENGQESVQEDESPSKKKGSKKSKKSRKSLEETNDESNGTAASSNEDAEEDNESETSKKKSKKGKKGRKSNSNAVESNGTEDTEESYEVETVLDQTTVRGVKQYLIRWKGYGADSDSWEPESTLSCPDLIQKFLASQKTPIKGKKRSSQGPASSKKKQKTDDDDEDDDEEEIVGEYEVDRILEVHHKKNGKREFLVHWKGYTSKDNTWEPEEHMNCPDLIDKFMARVEHAKESSTRELRVDRKPTKHFTLSMEQHGRRLSRRNLGKQRAQYKDFD